VAGRAVIVMTAGRLAALRRGTEPPCEVGRRQREDPGEQQRDDDRQRHGGARPDKTPQVLRGADSMIGLHDPGGRRRKIAMLS